jgi:cytochrome c oxidase subunit 3
VSDPHAHDHPPFLAHHFESPKQQFEAGKLGMWLFLATEVLLFGGLFVGYAVWRGNHPELFKFGSEYLDTKMGAINTAVLIASSLTMAWAVTAIQQNKQKLTLILLSLTFCGAATFMVIKYFEYTHKFHMGIYPGMKFYEGPHDDHGPGEAAHAEEATHAAAETPAAEVEPPAAETAPPAGDGPEAEATQIALAAVGPTGLAAGASTLIDAEPVEDETADAGEPPPPMELAQRPRAAHMFFNIYFMMTGLHGIHVIIGGFVIGWLIFRTRRGDFSREYFTPVDLGGLYWHVVDLIWIFLFPLFYLI